MADHFEKAKDDILLRTEGNGGPTNRDMLKAISALAEDQDVQHKESMAALADHKVEANVRDVQIAELQEWRRRSSETCIAKVREIAAEVAAELHGPAHQLHLAQHHGRDMTDPADSQFLETRESAHPGQEPDAATILELVKGWTLFKKIAYVALSAIITGTILFAISYYGSLWASDRAEQNFAHYEQTAFPTPIATVTVTPAP